MDDLDPVVTDWLARFAEAVGIAPPSDEEINDLLALAGVAAHASARQAAPLTCWMSARAGVTPIDALAAARRLADT